MRSYLLLLLYFPLLGGCNKDETNPLKIDFKDAPLPVIKASIKGTWQVYSTSGGLAGQTDYPRDFFMAFNNNLVDIIRTDTTYRIEIIWAKKASIRGGQTYLMERPDGGFSKIPEGIFNDTLVLYDNYPEGYVYLLVRPGE